MTYSTSHAHFDFSELGNRDRCKLLIGTVIPRLIALITMRDDLVNERLHVDLIEFKTLMPDEWALGKPPTEMESWP